MRTVLQVLLFIAALCVAIDLVRAGELPQKNPDATFHAAPKPLPKGAVTEDWPCFLGPSHKLVSTETKLLKQFPKDGLKLVWEATRGSGYAAPAILGERLVMFHRVGNEEVVECLHRETGERFWRFAYAAPYRDRYGYNDGPRAAPVIAGDSVYTLGVSNLLHCLELSTGRVRWSRDLAKDFKLKQNFFGCGATPLVDSGKLIVNVGAPGGPTVAAFDLQTGKLVWGAGKDWGQSYASPIPADVHGKHRVFVFAGGESKPPTGGLMCIDPKGGTVDFTFPWRGNRFESVNGSSPLIFGGDRVLVSECYGSGAALLQVAPDLNSVKQLWTNESFGTHFMVSIFRDGYLYGIDGHGPQDAFHVCVDANTGTEVWRTQPEWRERMPAAPGPRVGADEPRELTLGTYRAWLMPIGDDSRVLMLGEFGHLLWVDLSPNGYKERDRTRLFLAPETWTPPVVSRGLLYVCQNGEDRTSGKGPRLLCYDLRGTE
jgi:outer membrane protein assembly factor BamB